MKRQQPRVDPDFLIEGMRLKPAQSFCVSESLLVSAKTSCGAKFLKKLETQELKQKVGGGLNQQPHAEESESLF